MGMEVWGVKVWNLDGFLGLLGDVQSLLFTSWVWIWMVLERGRICIGSEAMWVASVWN